MVFIDYSALRDTLRKWITGPESARFDPSHCLDVERLGRRLCGDDREFIRVNLYTGTPATVDETEEGLRINGIPCHEHEAYKARGVLRAHGRLTEHVDTRCRFTRLVTGRMMARRVELRHGPAFDWTRQILETIGGGAMTEDDRAFFDNAARINPDARVARDELCRRIVALREQGQIPGRFMAAYSWRLAELLGEQIDFTEKGVDTRLTVEMLERCMNDSYDDAILFAADEDYVPLVEAVKRTGRHVVHAFWDVPNFGRALRTACDDFVVVGREELERMVV